MNKSIRGPRRRAASAAEVAAATAAAPGVSAAAGGCAAAEAIAEEPELEEAAAEKVSMLQPSPQVRKSSAPAGSVAVVAHAIGVSRLSDTKV